jgi:hypothetical protein
LFYKALTSRALRGVLAVLILFVLPPWTGGVARAAPAPARASDPAAAGLADRMLRRWAPAFVQHVAPDDRGQDRPTRIDFDGDWVMTNNWENQARLAATARAYVYGASVLTETHAYLTYYLFYARDWSRPVCLPYLCHENDFEAILLVVKRDGAAVEAAGGNGTLALAQSKTHFSFLGAAGAAMARDPDGRPMVSVEDYGHGLQVCRIGDPRCDGGEGRVRYELGAPGEPAGISPARPRGERVAYELLSLHATLWQRRSVQGGAATPLWEDAERPRVYPRHGSERVGAPLAAGLAGNKYSAGAMAPWGLSAPDARRGDWFLDPAMVALSHFELGGTQPGALRYVHNPFLDDLRRECVGAACAPMPPGLEDSAASPFGGAAFGVLLGLTLRPRRRRQRRPAR